MTEDMEKLGLFEGREDRDIALAHSDRSKTPIEPYLSDQWFVKMATRRLAPDGHGRRERRAREVLPGALRQDAISTGSARNATGASAGSCGGDIAFPIWYARCSGGGAEAARSPAATTWPGGSTRRTASGSICAVDDLPARRPGAEVLRWSRTPTCSTPGSAPRSGRTRRSAGRSRRRSWRYYYPTSVLVTSRDIITLWVARMVITGLYNVGEVPFHHVYIHPKILDGFGERMSKMQGQRHRSARHHRALRHRRPALRHGPPGHRERRTAGCRWPTCVRTATRWCR